MHDIEWELRCVVALKDGLTEKQAYAVARILKVARDLRMEVVAGDCDIVKEMISSPDINPCKGCQDDCMGCPVGR